jgi:hypothetical protein
MLAKRTSYLTQFSGHSGYGLLFYTYAVYANKNNRSLISPVHATYNGLTRDRNGAWTGSKELGRRVQRRILFSLFVCAGVNNVDSLTCRCNYLSVVI